MEARPKKKKDDRTTNIVNFDDNNFTFMTKALTKVVQERFKKIYEKQTELTSTITGLLKVICKVVEEVKIAVDYTLQTTESQDVPGTSEERKNEIPISVLQIRMQVSGEALDLGTP